jgi:trigger factor
VSSPDSEKLDVDVEVKELDGGQVELQVKVPPDRVEKVKAAVLREFGRRANIPGFRKGKAPRSVLERFVDQEVLRDRIIDSLLEDAYDAATEKAGIKPLDRARIGDADITEEAGLAFSATVTLRPEIELGEYEGLKVTRRVTPVTDENVEAELERVRSRRAQFRELPKDELVTEGDLAIVDYEMFLDGEKKEDASAQGYPLEVGADQLFPEMNEALPGSKAGETRDVEVRYREDHSDPSLAGKTAQFKVTVKEARRRQLPELDDDFAKEVSDLETLDALRQRIRENLEAVGKALAEEEVRTQLIQQVSETASLDVPEALVGREVDRRMEEVENELDRRGLTLHQHLQNTNRSFEDWRADIEADARAAARRALVLDESGERETIHVTDEEMHEEMHRQAEREGQSEQDLQERYSSDPAQFNRLVTRLYHRKTVQFLLDNADVTEEIVEPEAAEEDSADTASERGDSVPPEQEADRTDE